MDNTLHPNHPLRLDHNRIVSLDQQTPTVTVTAKQLQAINRLGLNGWIVDIAEMRLASDGMLEGLMENKSGFQMFVGIHPSGSTHT